uniref:MARVEL domain-containing protein n=1 Tax=Rhabditophanes sp. KR3021 TaxID=114890 RepID=A0AC35UG67_9BILA
MFHSYGAIRPIFLLRIVGFVLILIAEVLVIIGFGVCVNVDYKAAGIEASSSACGNAVIFSAPATLLWGQLAIIISSVLITALLLSYDKCNIRHGKFGNIRKQFYNLFLALFVFSICAGVEFYYGLDYFTAITYNNVYDSNTNSRIELGRIYVISYIAAAGLYSLNVILLIVDIFMVRRLRCHTTCTY